MNKYFDNGSTSYPKPKKVAEDVYDYIVNLGGTYGRAAYERVMKCTSIVESCRDKVAKIIGASDGANIFWSQNATMGSNTVLNSLDLKGKRILISPMEHNAITRPLHHLGVEWEVMPCFDDGFVDVEKLNQISKDNLALIIVNHQSNVNGVIQPIEDICKWAGDTEVMVDTSQSLGHINIDVEKNNIDYLIFTGHKGLLGVSGIGGYYSKNPRKMKPLIYGGTGTSSESYNMPNSYPDTQEAGTPNMVGVVGLSSAIDNKPKSLHTKEDVFNFIKELKKIDSLNVLCANDFKNQGELLSFYSAKITGSELVLRLNRDFGIECRYGVHCAPLAHRTLKTLEIGTIRVAFSPYHTPEDLEYLLQSIKKALI